MRVVPSSNWLTSQFNCRQQYTFTIPYERLLCEFTDTAVWYMISPDVPRWIVDKVPLTHHSDSSLWLITPTHHSDSSLRLIPRLVTPAATKRAARVAPGFPWFSRRIRYLVHYAVLDHVLLDHAVLDHAHLDHALLDHALLDHALLDHALLDHALLDHALLDHAVLDHALLDHAVLDHALLDHALLDHALLDHALLDHALLDHALLAISGIIRRSLAAIVHNSRVGVA